MTHSRSSLHQRISTYSCREEYTVGIHIIRHFFWTRDGACGSHFSFSHNRINGFLKHWRDTQSISLYVHMFLIPNRWDWSRLSRWMWTLPCWRAFGALQNWLKRIIYTSPRFEGQSAGGAWVGIEASCCEFLCVVHHDNSSFPVPLCGKSSLNDLKSKVKIAWDAAYHLGPHDLV